MGVKLLFSAIVSVALFFVVGYVAFNTRGQLAPAAVVLTTPPDNFALHAQPLQKISAAPVAQKATGPQISVTPPLAACDPRASVSITTPRPTPLH